MNPGSSKTGDDELDVLEDMEVYFNVLDDGYRVTTCCPRFASLVGLPEVEVRLLDLLVDEEALITQTQAVFSCAYQSRDFTVSKICKDVRFKQSQRIHGFHATIELSMNHNNTADDVQMWTVKAKLHDVRIPRGAPLGGPLPDGTATLQAAAWEKYSEGQGSACRLQRRRPRTTPPDHHS